MKDIIAELTAAVDALSGKHPELKAPCFECGRPGEFTCDCGESICSQHSYDTVGALAKFGLCPNCCDVVLDENAARTVYGISRS